MGYLVQVFEKTLLGIFRTRQAQIQTNPWYPYTGAENREHLTIDKAEKIVNAYGSALERASYLNKARVANLLDDLSNGKESVEKVSASLQRGDGKYHDLLTMKCEKSLLPYPRETIQEAIHLLLRHETDPENIRLLEQGLQYLESFS